MWPRLLAEWTALCSGPPAQSCDPFPHVCCVCPVYFSRLKGVAFHTILPAWVLTLNLPTPTHPPMILPLKGLWGPGCSHCKSACTHWPNESNLYQSRGSRKLKTWLSHKCVVWASIKGSYITLIRSSAKLRLTKTKNDKSADLYKTD